jgi:hypothetical protein
LPSSSPVESRRQGLTRPRAVRWVGYWLGAAAVLLPIWIAGRFPTEDGPAHLYYTEVYRDLANPQSMFRPFFERSVHWNTPNLTYFWMQYALAGSMEPHLAQRLAVSLILLATIAATFVLSLSLSSDIGIGTLAALVLLHNSFLYAGYFSFLAGLPFLLLSVALLVGPLDRTKPENSSLAWSLVAVLLLGVLAFYSHLVVAGVLLLLVGFRAVFWPGVSRSRRGLLILAAAPVALLIVSYMLGPSTGGGGLRWSAPSDAIHSLVRMWFWQGFAVQDLGYRIRIWVFRVILALLVWLSGRELITGAASRPRQFVLLAAAGFFLLRLVVPDAVGQGGVLLQRLDLLTWTLALPALSANVSRKAQLTLTVLVLFLLGWQLSDAALRVRRFDREYRAVEAQVAAIPRGSVIQPGPSLAATAGFEGSFAQVLGEISQEIGYQCQCIVTGGHHPRTPYFWVRARAGQEAQARFLVRVDATNSVDGARPRLSLRLTGVARSAAP